MVERKHHSSTAAVLPRFALAAAEIVLMYAYAQACAAQAATRWTAAGAEQTKRTRFRKSGSGRAAFCFVRFAAETCGYMVKAVVRFQTALGTSLLRGTSFRRLCLWL